MQSMNQSSQGQTDSWDEWGSHGGPMSWDSSGPQQWTNKQTKSWNKLQKLKEKKRLEKQSQPSADASTVPS